MENINKVIASSDAGNITMTTDTNRFVGDKLYEMSNHLGNVLVTVTDRKLPEAVTVDHLCFATASSEYAVTSSFAAGLSTKMTLEGWVKTTGTGNYTVAAYYDGGVNKGMVLGVSGGLPVITGRNGTASGYVIWGTSNLADGNWHHVVATSDNGVWTIYADGQVENTFTSAAGGFTSMNEPFFIGANMYGAYIDGCIKEVSFWNYAKAASEVNTDYVNYDGYTGSETGIIGYWKCDEGTGTSLDDLTSGNHNASLINTPTWSSDDYIAYNMPDVQSYSDYYPFGMVLPGRNGSASEYKYGFNGMEKDDEIKGDHNSYDFGARIYDPRVGRWLSGDPMESKYPSFSTYSSFGNNPILLIDPNGKEIIIHYVEDGQDKYYTYTPGIVPLTSNEFVQQVHTSITYTMHNDANNTFTNISNSDETVTINQIWTDEDKTTGNPNFETNKVENVQIFWNPTTGLQNADGTALSPATALLHEAAHAERYIATDTPQEMKDLANDLVPDGTVYDNAEEKRVIDQIETPYINATNKNVEPPYNQTKQKEGTRTNHRGTTYTTTGPTSITPADGSSVKGQSIPLNDALLKMEVRDNTNIPKPSVPKL